MGLAEGEYHPFQKFLEFPEEMDHLEVVCHPSRVPQEAAQEVARVALDHHLFPYHLVEAAALLQTYRRLPVQQGVPSGMALVE